RQRSVRAYFITRHNFFLRIPVGDVQIFFVRRERYPVWPFKIGAYELELTFVKGENTTVRQLLTRIVEELRQAEGRIGEEQSSIRAIDEVVGAVEPLAFVSVGQHGQMTVLLQTDDTPVPVLVNGEPSLAIDRQPVGARLGVFRDIPAGVTAVVFKHRERSVG